MRPIQTAGFSRTILKGRGSRYCYNHNNHNYTSPFCSRSTAEMASDQHEESSYHPRYIDVAINLADPIFRGVYNGKQRHPDDLDAIITRARDVGCQKLLVTGSDFTSSRDALEIAQKYPGIVYTTVGIHPCSSSVFGTGFTGNGMHDPPADHHLHEPSASTAAEPKPSLENTNAAISELRDIISGSGPSLVALGEFGLDYDRLHYCPKELQRHSFASQLELATSLRPQLPLFLHSRAAHRDFVMLLKDAFGDRLETLQRGAVVHSFTGTLDEMRELTDLGLYIGINGCSLKTEENCRVVGEIPLECIMLETDGPWCEVRPSHAGWKYLVSPRAPALTSAAVRFKTVKKEKWVQGAMVKGRNEPCMIEQIATIVAGIKTVTVQQVCESAMVNTMRVFKLD